MQPITPARGSAESEKTNSQVRISQWGVLVALYDCEIGAEIAGALLTVEFY